MGNTNYHDFHNSQCDTVQKNNNNNQVSKIKQEKRNSQSWRLFHVVPPLPPPSVCLSRTGCLLQCTCPTECLKRTFMSVSERTGVCENDRMYYFRCRNAAFFNNAATSKPNKMRTCVHKHLKHTINVSPSRLFPPLFLSHLVSLPTT